MAMLNSEKGDFMNIENSNLKICLVIQSFAPLFLLLIAKYCDIKLSLKLACSFFNHLCSTGIDAFGIAINHIYFGSFVISTIGIAWVAIASVIAIGVNGIQKAGFKLAGEKIKIEDSTNDSGAMFLVTYVLPLLTDDVKSFRGLIVFLMILTTIILLLARSNTFYQNPVLSLMKYRTFSFKFLNPSDDIIHPEKTYIGITRRTPIMEDTIIKRKYISDGVFIIYND